ncbi:PREDICTED: ras guanine nucleotide exchange factor B isoform X2 [Polistes dominula]|uniref:Ras guanine nucleotide exchange factor B isoform X2 n=1 Tax=Polistes dominula TaxID=743375 RepID=A0ABM1J9R6_POLDO|nr:PREDICTED: ras guanine nucleotide exchange factor B isoform X2 [Polistes dominula]XP_015189205.1 PREDICTED: ras guanine nucleotide exchange factor B isoform X2 [Polistes dominula]
MRLKETIVTLPLHPGGLNNNQLHRNNENQATTEEVNNQNETSTSTDFGLEETVEFHVAEDTTIWSSLAIARDDIQLITTNNGRNNINNNLTTSRIRRNSSIDSLADYEGRNSSSREDSSSHELTPSEWSDLSEEGNLPSSGCCGIVNTNYPGFQHLAPSLLSDTDLTEDEHDSCPDYIRLNDIDARSSENGNEYNNNIDESINHLCGQRNDHKTFYEKPKFNIQTVTSLYESVVPPSEKCINYVKSVEVSRSEEKTLSPEPEIIETDNFLTLESEDTFNHHHHHHHHLHHHHHITEEILQTEHEGQELNVELEVLKLSIGKKETLQFPEIEEILDSGKTSEIGETEDSVVEQQQHIDLIREAKELPRNERTKIGNQATTTTTTPSPTPTPPLPIPTVTETTLLSNVSPVDSETTNTDTDNYTEEQSTYTKLEEIDLLSSIGRDIGVDLEKYVQSVPDVIAMEAVDTVRCSSRGSSRGSSRSASGNRNMRKDPHSEDTNKLLDRDLSDTSSADSRKKEKTVRNQTKRRQQQQQQQPVRSSNSRRPDKRRADTENGPGGFDVFNIETAMPKIDLDAIESHLRAAEEERREDDNETTTKTPVLLVPEVTIREKPKEEEKDPEREDLIARFDRLIRGDPDETLQRRTDREEIRRRLAMGPDAEDMRAERGRKPSLQSRLQSGMNLQICFMNETPSDTESSCSESDALPGSTPMSRGSKQQTKQQAPSRPQVLSLPPLRLDSGTNSAPVDEADFFARQAKLQTEARMALAQAKEMAHMQMEVERQRLKQSPITEMVRSSLEKVGVQLGEDRRRLSRVLLTELNVAQLQVIANDLHARIAALNEALVEGLLSRDDLHMEQDSMLVDVEDLTRYLGAKQESMKKKQQQQQQTVTANRNNQQQQQQQQQQQTTINQLKNTIKPKLTHRSLVALVRK